jgi:hypothetical protein
VSRPPINLYKRSFKTKLEAQEWVARQVLRRTRRLEYCLNVNALDTEGVQVEIVDTASEGFAPDANTDEPLAKEAYIFQSGGVYRVAIPA